MVAARWVTRRATACVLLPLSLACSASSTTETVGDASECLAAQPKCPIPGYPDVLRCTDQADCPSGLVCEDFTLTSRWSPLCYPEKVCWAPCDCVGGDVCTATGQCRPPRCDEPAAEPCPERFRCDPDAAADDVGAAIGATTGDEASWQHTRAAGCVRMRCDETGGFVCEERYRCAPEESTRGIGCVPRPCTDTGLCAADSFTCNPAGSHARVGMDPFGCVRKNCDDPDYACEGVHERVGSSDVTLPRACDFDSPAAGPDGCVVPRCDMPGGGCPADWICDPTSERPKASNGCRHARCPDEFDCPTGRHCDPGARSIDDAGCAVGEGEVVPQGTCK